MKKVLTALAAIAIAGFVSCKKDDPTVTAIIKLRS